MPIIYRRSVSQGVGVAAMSWRHMPRLYDSAPLAFETVPEFDTVVRSAIRCLRSGHGPLRSRLGRRRPKDALGRGPQPGAQRSTLRQTAREAE